MTLLDLVENKRPLNVALKPSVLAYGVKKYSDFDCIHPTVTSSLEGQSLIQNDLKNHRQNHIEAFPLKKLSESFDVNLSLNRGAE